MAKASSNIISLEFYNKKTNKIEKTFDQIKRVAKFIGRANDPTKCIGNKNSKFLLANIADQINRSKTGVIFIDHDWISEITDCLTDQNLNLLKQLSDIFHFDYHRFIIFEGEKKCYGYTVKYTDDGIERINNPELFYPQFFDQNLQNNCKKSSATRPKKYDYVAEEIRPQDQKNTAIHVQVQYRDLDILDINTDLSDLCTSEDSSLCIEGKDQKNQDTNFISSNQTKPEANKELNNNPPVDELLEVARQEFIQAKGQQTNTHTRNGNVYHSNKLLNEFDFTDELIDAIREKSDKPHFPNGRITAVMRNIVAKNPNLRIWGGRQAFINYMVKAINNEKEFTKEEKVREREEKARSLAEMKKKEAEQLLYDFQHRVIRYF